MGVACRFAVLGGDGAVSWVVWTRSGVVADGSCPDEAAAFEAAGLVAQRFHEGALMPVRDWSEVSAQLRLSCLSYDRMVGGWPEVKRAGS